MKRDFPAAGPNIAMATERYADGENLAFLTVTILEMLCAARGIGPSSRSTPKYLGRRLVYRVAENSENFCPAGPISDCGIHNFSTVSRISSEVGCFFSIDDAWQLSFSGGGPCERESRTQSVLNRSLRSRCRCRADVSSSADPLGHRRLPKYAAPVVLGFAFAQASN
jgi:hypothetical protein